MMLSRVDLSRTSRRKEVVCIIWVSCTLFVHALLYGVFIVGFRGVVECFAQARRCHFAIQSLYAGVGVIAVYV